MHPELRGLASRQRGVFTRRQAAECGCSEREIKTRTGALGDWALVRRGAYAEAAVWAAADDEERYRMRVVGSLLMTRARAVVSHSSAAAFLGFPMRPAWMGLVHVTRPGVTGGRTEGGVKHHLAGLDAWEVSNVGPLRLTGPARTSVDVAREFGFEDGVVAMDAALASGTTHEELRLVLERMRHWPQVTRARAAAAVADGGAQSIGETLTRLLVLELGLGRPRTQVPMTDGRNSAVVDLLLRRHIIEFDGRVKYVDRRRGGVAAAPPEQVVWDEKRREDWLRRHDGGHGVSRVTWSDLWGAARRHTRARLAEDIARSDSLFGHLDETRGPVPGMGQSRSAS